MNTSNPENWIAPVWHPDCGDAEEELRLLKTFCGKLIQQHPEYSVKLALPEEGYMNVDIFMGQNTKIGELLIVVAGGKKQYALFLFQNGEEEYYFDEVHEGIGYLAHGNLGSELH